MSIATEFDKFKDALFNEKIIRHKMKTIQDKKRLSENCSPEKLPTENFPPENYHLWKLPAMKIPTYESSLLWKFRPLKITPLKIIARKLTPRKFSPMKVATIVARNWKLLPCSPYLVMKNKAWRPVWWSWVSWKYKYLFNLTWIVVFS